MNLSRAKIENLIDYLCDPDPALTPLEMCQLNGISLNQYYRWKATFFSLDKNKANTLQSFLAADDRDKDKEPCE